jgi:alcohol dehydrogenase (cytochrome c)
MRKLILILPATLLLTAGALALRSSFRAGRPTGRAPVSDTRLLAAKSAPENWLTHGRDYSNQRYSPLTQINRKTVGRLGPVWRHSSTLLFQRVEKNESTPLVDDGLLIYTEGKNVVIALDARTGREFWRYNHPIGAAALCCGLVNRGVALYGDKVFLATIDARLVALDRATGKVVWNKAIAPPSAGYSFSMAPLAAGGKIVVGASGGEFGIRGFVDAYDPDSGKRVWRFWTIPTPEEGGWWGHWTDTTPEGDHLPRDIAREKRDSARFGEGWRHGGGPVWSTPAYDPELGLLIFGTGNPSPIAGESQPGDNLYTMSLLAVELATGKLRWYHQTLPHDIWDYDLSSPVVLFDVTRNGATIPAAGQAGKTGWVTIVDRRTGKLLLRSDPFVPQENLFHGATLKGVKTSPASRGGSTWPPNAYSPRTGLMYVLGNYYPQTFVLDSANMAVKSKKGELNTYAAFHQLPYDSSYGTFSAIDVNTGRIRWQRRVAQYLTYGGALVTAGDLVFFGEKDGTLNALDAESGATLWRQRVDTHVVGPPIAFQVDGEERIATTSRRGISVLGLR